MIMPVNYTQSNLLNQAISKRLQGTSTNKNGQTNSQNPVIRTSISWKVNKYGENGYGIECF